MSSVDLKQYGRTRVFKAPANKRVGILFSGGPAPGANAVISAAAISLLNNGYEVIGFYDGYSHLVAFDKNRPGETMQSGEHYKNLTLADVTPIRHLGGSILRTARTNPSKVSKNKEIKRFEDFGDPELTQNFDRALDALEYMNISSMITIGGDDTLKSAYYFHLLGVPTVHVPKTIDNDYYGIAWTFGYFSAIERARQDLLIYREETKTTRTWFVLEMMGRKAGWYCMGAGIAGGATRMIIPEEIEGELNFDHLVEELVDLVIAREKAGKHDGVILLSEGLADLLPEATKLKLAKRHDEYNNIKLSDLKIGEQITSALEEAYEKRTGKPLKVKNGVIGYTTRCIEPTAFDVLLSSQLGMGAGRFIQAGNFGHMVSVGEELRISMIPFSELIDKKTLKTRQRYVDLDADFYKLGTSLQFHARNSNGKNK